MRKIGLFITVKERWSALESTGCSTDVLKAVLTQQRKAGPHKEAGGTEGRRRLYALAISEAQVCVVVALHALYMHCGREQKQVAEATAAAASRKTSPEQAIAVEIYRARKRSSSYNHLLKQCLMAGYWQRFQLVPNSCWICNEAIADGTQHSCIYLIAKD